MVQKKIYVSSLCQNLVDCFHLNHYEIFLSKSFHVGWANEGERQENKINVGSIEWNQSVEAVRMGAVI